jgi:hypothetical protein
MLRPAPLLVVVSLTLLLASSASALDERWFERTFAVELVTSAPPGEEPTASLGALYVGDGAMRLEGSEDDVPFVLLYRFAADEVELWILEPVGSTAMRFVFELDGLVEIDVLNMGALVLSPEHPAHPCALRPVQAHCFAEGRDDVAGEGAERWLVELEDGFGYVESFTVWVDGDGRVVRTAYPDGYVVDFVDFRPGPQPAELFEIPEDYEQVW